MRIITLLLMFMFIVPSSALGEVFMFDAVAAEDNPVMFKARTGGRFFKKGGELVTFILDGEEIGRTLSGGDGIAYLEYVPHESGQVFVVASIEDDRSAGILLVVGKEQEVVLVGIEQALTEGELILPVMRKGASEAVKRISERFPVIFISTGPAGEAFDRRWLKDNGFLDAPVMEWKSGSFMRKLESLGIRVKAVIGSTKLSVRVKDSDNVMILYFDESSKKDHVDSWNDVLERLEEQ